MAQTQLLNRRIRSVKNAEQITKAMEVVAASRMRRVQDAAAKARAYGELASSIIAEVSKTQEAAQHPYFRPVKPRNRLYIIFTSDRGLAGAFNSNVFNNSHRAIADDKKSGTATQVVVLGRKGAHYFSRFDGAKLVGEYENLEDIPSVNVFAPIIDTINDGFASGQIDAVNLIYTEFVSTLTQTVHNSPLLPVAHGEDKATSTSIYELEPSNDAVLKEAIRLYLESQLIRARVDSSASEYAMRMLAMSNANRNASDLMDHLTLELNASRQAAITQEMAEITGGANAVA